MISLSFALKSFKALKQSFKHIEKVHYRQGGKRKGKKQDRKMKSRMRTASVWQKSRDILPQRFSLSSPFSLIFSK